MLSLVDSADLCRYLPWVGKYKTYSNFDTGISLSSLRPSSISCVVRIADFPCVSHLLLGNIPSPPGSCFLQTRWPLSGRPLRNFRCCFLGYRSAFATAFLIFYCYFKNLKIYFLLKLLQKRKIAPNVEIVSICVVVGNHWVTHSITQYHLCTLLKSIHI